MINKLNFNQKSNLNFCLKMVFTSGGRFSRDVIGFNRPEVAVLSFNHS